MKNTRALSHIRQLCCLGVDSHAVIPAITAAMHELIPSAHNLFIWTDGQGNVINQYCESFVPAALEASQQNLPGKPDIVALAMRGKPVGNVRERPADFYETPHYNEAYRPMRARNSLDAVIRTADGPQGIMVLHRDSEQPFTEEEQSELEGVLPYLRNIWTGPRSENAEVFADTADHGTIICSPLGEIQFISASASQLMLMAKKQGSLSDCGPATCLPAELGAMIQRLVNIDTPHAYAEPPALQLSNRWGKFIFRAVWLEGMTAQNRQLISISIWRQEPLAVSIVRGFQNSPLSPKQRDVALMLVTGRSAEEIVRELSISITTYKDHLRKIYEKLGITKRSDLIRRLTQPVVA